MDRTCVIVAGAAGRSSEFEKLSDLIANHYKFVAIVSGPLGIGKSELTNSFSRHQLDANRNQTIRLNGASANILKYTCFQLAQLLGFKTVENGKLLGPVEIIKGLVSQMQNSLKRVLLIVENVDDFSTHAGVLELLATEVVRSNCFVIVNCSNVQELLNCPSAEVIHLDVLSTPDSVEHIKKTLTEESAKDMKNLCQLVKNFPLALQLAISFIKMQKQEQSQYQIQNYLNEFSIEKCKPDIVILPSSQIDPEYSDIFTIVAWNLSIATLKNKCGPPGKLAVQLLDLLAYFEPEEIHHDFIFRVHAEISNNQEISQVYVDAMRLLFDYSLVKGTNTAVQIHRLIQQLLRLHVTSSEVQEIDFLKGLMKGIVNRGQTMKQTDIRHMLSSWKHASKFDQLILEFATFPNFMINLLNKFCLYWEVADFSNEIWENMKRVLGENHPETIKIESHMADALRWSDSGAKAALCKYKTLYEKIKTIFGEEHQLTVSTGIQCAWLLATQLKRIDESLEIIDKAMISIKKMKGEHNYTELHKNFKLLADVGETYETQSRHQDALNVQEGLLELQVRHLGERHPDVFKTIHRIGLVLLQQNEFSRAKKNFQKVMEHEVKLLGESHAHTRATRNYIHLCDNQLEKAEVFEGESQEDLAIFSDLLKNCPLASKLAVRYLKVQSVCAGKECRPGNKIKYFLKNYLTQKVKLMDDPFNPFGKDKKNNVTQEVTLITKNLSIDLIKNYGDIGNLALEILYVISYLSPERICLELVLQIYNHNAPQTRQSFQNIEAALKLMGKFAIVQFDDPCISVDPLIQQLVRLEISSSDLEVDFLRNCVKAVLCIEERLTSNDMPHVASLWLHASKHNLLIMAFDSFYDKICDKFNSLSMKKELLEMAVVGREKLRVVLGANHLQTLIMGTQIGDALRINGRFEEALQIYLEIYPQQKLHLGEGHIVTLCTGNNLALVLREMEKWDEALKLYREIVEAKKRFLGETHADTLLSLRNLAECLWNHGTVDLPHNLGDFIKAVDLWEEVLKLEIQTLGDDHPITLTSKYNLAFKLCGFNKPGRAHDLLKQVLTARERILGPQHPDTVKTRHRPSIRSLGPEDYNRSNADNPKYILIIASTQNN